MVRHFPALAGTDTFPAAVFPLCRLPDGKADASVSEARQCWMLPLLLGPRAQLRVGARTVQIAQDTTHHERSLLLRRLEAAMAELGSGIDELQLNGFQLPAFCVNQKGLEEGETTRIRLMFKQAREYKICLGQS